MAGYKYAIAMDHLDYHGVLHTYAHILFIQTQEEQSDVITLIMTQLSLKEGFK